ncbi:MAG TPA: phage tail protein [Solirubrobacteraceae bacterium]|nr:phage tail protein [Solirubrobacteraceae bacterium]
MPDERHLVPVAFIKMDIGGAEGDGLFMSCTLPSGTITQDAKKVYDQQGGNEEIHAPAHLNWSDIQLTRGIDDKKSMYDWFMKIAEEGPAGNTKLCKLELLDHKQQTVMTWSLENAWISSYSASASEAGGGGVAIESMSLSYTTAKREA